MLTEEDKNRIRLEEIYRHELRQQLQSHVRRSKTERMVAFVNTAFFLWFMSTVLVGAISFMYTRWDRNREDGRRKYEQERLVQRESGMAAGKLDTEIASRLRFVNGLIETEHSFPQKVTLVKAILILEKPAAVEYPVNVFPEYSNRSFQSLLWELMQVVPDGEKAEVSKASEEAKKLTALFITEAGAAAPKPAARRAKAVKRVDLHDVNETALMEDQSRLIGVIGLQAFNLDRWGKPLVSVAGK